MNGKIFLLFFVLSACWLQLAMAIVCPEGPRTGKECAPVNCGKSEIKLPGSSGCCPYCAKVIKVGGDCKSVVGSRPTSVCIPGSECINGVCESIIVGPGPGMGPP